MSVADLDIRINNRQSHDKKEDAMFLEAMLI